MREANFKSSIEKITKQTYIEITITKPMSIIQHHYILFLRRDRILKISALPLNKQDYFITSLARQMIISVTKY